MEEKGFDPIDVLLEKPFWIVDPLPYQVPAEGEGQFFAVESFFLESSRRRLLLKRHRHVRRAGDQIMEIMKALNPDENLENMVEGSEFLILQYGDEACAPCLTLRIKIKNWLKGHTGIEGRYIPICEYSEIAAQRGILSVPTIEVYAFGKLMIRESGYFSLDQIFEQMERYLRIKGEKYAECKWKRSKIP